MSVIETILSGEAISVQKENGTNVDYYIFDEFEIHDNVLMPGAKQEWHRHAVIDETYFVAEGEITFCWVEEGRECSRVLRAKDALCAKSSVHTVRNETDEPATFIVFRMVPDGVSKRETIRNDKVVVSENGLPG